jgi:hypothetical protein
MSMTGAPSSLTPHSATGGTGSGVGSTGEGVGTGVGTGVGSAVGTGVGVGVGVGTAQIECVGYWAQNFGFEYTPSPTNSARNAALLNHFFT